MLFINIIFIIIIIIINIIIIIVIIIIIEKASNVNLIGHNNNYHYRILHSIIPKSKKVVSLYLIRKLTFLAILFNTDGIISGHIFFF